MSNLNHSLKVMKKLLRCLGCRKTNSRKYYKNHEINDKNKNIVSEEEVKKSYNSGVIFKPSVPELIKQQIPELKNIENIINKTKSLIIDDDSGNKITTDTTEKNSNYDKLGLNLKLCEDIDENEFLLLPDSPLILPCEKKINFTKKGLIEIWDKFWNLDNYKNIWNKDDLIIEERQEGTFLTSNFCLIKITYRVNKKKLNNNTDLDTILAFFYDSEIRSKWDQSCKELRIYEGIPMNNYIQTSWAKKPAFFMSDRESLEKKFTFKNTEKNIVYIMASSIPDEIHPVNGDVVRLINYCNYFKIVDEGDYIGYYSLNQSDFKMAVPQLLMNMGLPTTTKNWYSQMLKFAGEVTYDKNTKKIVEKKNNANNKN